MTTEAELQTPPEGTTGPADGEGVEQVPPPETAVETAPAPDPSIPEADPDEFFKKVASAFEDEPADEVKKLVAASDVANIPVGSKERGIVRAVVARLEEARAKDATAAAKREAEYKAREEALEAKMGEFARSRAALYALVNSPGMEAARKAQKPEVDPLTPEGQEKLAEYNAARGIARALDPLYKESAQTQRTLAWKELEQTYPSIVKHKSEFDAFMAKQNEGIKADDVREGKATWRLKADVGAQLFHAQKRAEELEAEAKARKAAEVADRAAAGRAITRAPSGGHAVSDLTIPDEVYERGEVTEYLNRLPPERRAAVIAHSRRQAAHA